MRRKLYRSSELKAGKTLFIVTRTLIDHFGKARFDVAEHVVAGKREAQPEPGSIPYRLHPGVAQYAIQQTDVWRTRRAALRESARRQAANDRQISSRSA